VPKEDGYQEAIQTAIDKLQKVNLTNRCLDLGLPLPETEGLPIRALGSDHYLQFSDYRIVFPGSEQTVKPTDRILIYHYLLCETPVRFTDTLISFRDLSGGQFYWGPFRARSVAPLEKRFGNNLEQLRRNLGRFDWQETAIGDLSARIHVIGNLYASLIYRLGDDELPPAADLLFDAAIKRVYNAEDAAVLAGRICLGLL